MNNINNINNINNMSINANPTKEFFISMLTRDIDLKAAILELIDNSIDGAKRMRPSNDFSGLYIKIKFDKEKFEIEDNCGGMSIKIAQENAFRFGKSSKKNEDGLYTGVFGIGMKRSLFRIGKKFQVISKTINDRFIVNVDLDKWMLDSDVDWTFKFSEAETNLVNDISECGTKITIEKIYEGISRNFELDFFEQSLRAYVEKYRTMAAENGLQIYINDKKITFLKDELIKSKYIQPYSKSSNIGKIKVSILAGVAPKGKPEKAGWYIYCNGRMIVYADKTTLTGWGENGVRMYHPSLACFRGYVFFESTALNELPWNTTKTSVDTSSQYYIAAKDMMREALLQVTELIKSINNYDEEEQSQVEDKILSREKTISLTSTEIQNISKNENFYFKLPEHKELIKMTTINFKKPLKQVEELKEIMNVSTNKEVGEHIFDYYYSRECE